LFLLHICTEPVVSGATTRIHSAPPHSGQVHSKPCEPSLQPASDESLRQPQRLHHHGTACLSCAANPGEWRAAHLSRPCHSEHQTTFADQGLIAAHDDVTGFPVGRA